MFLDEFNVNSNYIMNPELKSDFFYSKYGHMNKLEIETIIRFFNVVGIAEQQNKKDFNSFNFKEVLDLFERNEWVHANTFAHHKSLLKQYIEWCKLEGKIPSEIHPIERLNKKDITGEIKFDRQYFKDFESLKSCIDEVFDTADVDDISQYLFSKLVYCLSWLGFTKEEVRFLKKKEVDIENRTIKSELSGYQVDNLNDYIIKLIEECINIKEFTSHNRFREKMVKYQESDYLIRTIQTSKIQ